MKRITMLVLGIILLSSLTIAGLTSILSSVDEKSTLTSEELNKVENYFGVEDLDVSVSKIECGEEFCSAKVEQEGLIKTTFQYPKGKCFSWDKDTLECNDFKGYTEQELKTALRDFIDLELRNKIKVNDIRTEIKTDVVASGRVS